MRVLSFLLRAFFCWPIAYVAFAFLFTQIGSGTGVPWFASTANFIANLWFSVFIGGAALVFVVSPFTVLFEEECEAGIKDQELPKGRELIVLKDRADG